MLKLIFSASIEEQQWPAAASAIVEPKVIEALAKMIGNLFDAMREVGWARRVVINDQVRRQNLNNWMKWMEAVNRCICWLSTIDCRLNCGALSKAKEEKTAPMFPQRSNKGWRWVWRLTNTGESGEFGQRLQCWSWWSKLLVVANWSVDVGLVNAGARAKSWQDRWSVNKIWSKKESWNSDIFIFYFFLFSSFAFLSSFQFFSVFSLFPMFFWFVLFPFSKLKIKNAKKMAEENTRTRFKVCFNTRWKHLRVLWWSFKDFI